MLNPASTFFAVGAWKFFNVGKKGGLALFEFLGGGIVGKKEGVDLFKGGAADNFLKVILNSW